MNSQKSINSTFFLHFVSKKDKKIVLPCRFSAYWGITIRKYGNVAIVPDGEPDMELPNAAEWVILILCRPKVKAK